MEEELLSVFIFPGNNLTFIHDGEMRLEEVYISKEAMSKITKKEPTYIYIYIQLQSQKDTTSMKKNDISFPSILTLQSETRYDRQIDIVLLQM